MLDDFVAFLRRCKAGLTSTGFICIKDNIANGKAILDEQDSSVTRYDSTAVNNLSLTFYL